MTTKKTADSGKTAAEIAGQSLAQHGGYAGSAGAAYLAAWAPALDSWRDGAAIADLIDGGELVACPRCHFLHLPALAFPVERADLAAAAEMPVDACDVCAAAPAAAEMPFHNEEPAKDYEAARAQLVEAREGRARLLYDLWISATENADIWVLAALGDALAGVRERARGDAPAPDASPNGYKMAAKLQNGCKAAKWLQSCKMAANQ